MSAYTASQIASALGSNRVLLYRWLKASPADSASTVNGKAIQAWSWQAIPATVRERINEKARAENYRSGEDMLKKLSDAALSAVLKPWEPSIPVADIHVDDVRAAKKLCEALRATIARRNDPGITAAELQQLGIAEFKRVFGYPVKPSKWARLFKRALDRAGASGDFARWEIYLGDQLRTAAHSAAKVPPDFSAIRRVIDGFQQPPTAGDLANLWQHSFQWLEERTFEQVRAKRILIRFLYAHARFSKSESALRRKFDWTYRKWIGSGRTIEALKDARKAERPIVRCFTDDDIDVITHLACRNHRCEITPAVWSAYNSGKLSEILNESLAMARKKHRSFPTVLRDAVRLRIQLVKAHYQGPRAVHRQRAWIERDLSKLKSMWAITADDLTPPVITYLPKGDWYEFGRFQLIAVMDFRSWCFLGWCLVPTPTYNALHVRGALNTVLREEGFPKVFIHEGGAFDAKMITGSGDALSENDFEVAIGHASGMRFIHARSPEAKSPIEKSFDLLQDRMSCLPGFTGRNERFDRPEQLSKQMAFVKARKKHPGEFWMSFDEFLEGSPHRSAFGSWSSCVDRLCADFNNTPLHGRYHQGLTPEQVFERNKDRDDPPVKFRPEHQWMFGHCIETTVKERTGISFEVRGKRYRYFGAQTSSLIGQRVRAWFDHDHPESLAVTDLKNKNPFVVERANAVDPLNAGEELSIELGRASAHAKFSKAHYQHLKRKFEPTVRPMLPDRSAMEVSQVIDNQKKQAAAREQAKIDRNAQAKLIAHETGLPLEMIIDDPQRWLPMVEAKRAMDRERQIETEGAQ